MRSISLGEFVDNIERHAGAAKDQCCLIHPAYRSSAGDEEISRESGVENTFDRQGVIILDCDNAVIEGAEKKVKDPEGLRKFKDWTVKEGLSCLVYETSSSTEDWPRWRALIPLSREIAFDKTAKKVEKAIFEAWGDAAATWFNPPEKRKLGTLWANEGRPYDAGTIEGAVRTRKALEALERTIQARNRRNREEYYEVTGGRPDYHNLPSVKEYFETAGTGNWHLPLVKAINGIKKNIGQDAARDFLEEARNAGLPEGHYREGLRDIEK